MKQLSKNEWIAVVVSVVVVLLAFTFLAPLFFAGSASQPEVVDVQPVSDNADLLEVDEDEIIITDENGNPIGRMKMKGEATRVQ